MFCKNCGQEIKENASFCMQCGNPAIFKQDDLPPNRIGFSPRINDPSFAAYQKKSSAWSLIFAAILAVIAMIGFPVYGNISGEIDWPASLFYGFGIGGMFVLIAAIQIIRRRLDKTWDGIVEYKNCYKVMEQDSDDSGHHHHMMYVLKIRKDSGGKKTHKWRDMPGPYNYYNIGDKVRHHKGFYYYEKYDKTHDSVILCAACMSVNDITADICPKCKCPLLK